MKKINKSIFAIAGLFAGALACTEPDLPLANTYFASTAYKATFTFANATMDAAALDVYVNGVKLGTAAPSAGLPIVSTIQLPSPGVAGNNTTLTANASIRCKATTGTIGGKVGANDLIYRSAANGANNFAAVNGANYTVIAVDSLQRPQPKRLNSFRGVIQVAEATYWNPSSGSMIAASRRDSLNPANCKTTLCTTCTGCDNWDDANQIQTTSTATEFANLVTVGLVPLGLTDPGGVRFHVMQDVPLTFTAGTVVTNAGIRFVNAIANSNNITAVANTNGSFGGPPVYARLNGGTPINLTAVTAPPGPSNAYVAGAAGGFTPTAGSRTAGNVAFTTQVIAAAGVPNAYTLQLATDNAFTNIVYSAPVSFVPGKNYTIFVRGRFTSLLGIQANISHGIVTH